MTAAIVHRRQMRSRYFKLFVVETHITHSEVQRALKLSREHKRVNFFFLMYTPSYIFFSSPIVQNHVCRVNFERGAAPQILNSTRAIPRRSLKSEGNSVLEIGKRQLV